MIEIRRTNANNTDFQYLVTFLDKELAERDGDEHAFYAQYNHITNISHVVVAYVNNLPVACGAIKKWDADTMEVKRMYTLPEFRGKGIALEVLAQLESSAMELGYSKCILETGKKQPEAIQLYTRAGYSNIENYGQYAGVINSVCFGKELKKL